MIAVPAAAFEQTVDDALAVGARALVGITAGLGELGPEAQARERALVERVRAAGAMLLGPNCLGVFDATSDLGLASNEFPPGSIGLISQSGNLALELGILARAADMGFSRFASVGNQADVDLAELVASFAAHEGTELIAVYAEDFSDGRAFVDAAAAASTPVVLLTVGRSDASIRAAVSHTGALVSDVSVVEAACRSAGAYLVSTPGEMIDLAQALLRARPLAGPRVAVVGDGGGHGAIACDVAASAGLELPLLSPELAGRPGGVASAHRGDPKSRRPGRGRRAGLLLVCPRRPGCARVGRGRRGAPHGVLRRLQPVLRRVRGPGGGCRPRGRPGRGGDRQAARGPDDVRRLADRRRPACRERPGLPEHRVRGRRARRAPAAPARLPARPSCRPSGPLPAARRLLRSPRAARGGRHRVRRRPAALRPPATSRRPRPSLATRSS